MKTTSKLIALRSWGDNNIRILYSIYRCILLCVGGFELDPHYCQLPVAEGVQPDRNSCPAVLTEVWIVLESNYARIYSTVQKF